MNESILVEVFGGLGRWRVLRALFAEPGRGFGQRELAATAGVDPGSVARLLRRWVAAGLVVRRQSEGLPRYSASRDPALLPLARWMQQDSELVSTLRNALSPMRGVEVALVFGSVAAGQAHAASDVDVLVLGAVSELKLNAALKPAGRALGRAVRATACSTDSFRNQMRRGESFALGIVHGPRIALVGDLHAAILQSTGR